MFGALQQRFFQNHWRTFTHNFLGLYLILTNLLKVHFLNATDFILPYKFSRGVHRLGPVYLSRSFVSSVALDIVKEITIGSFYLVFAILLVKAVSIFMGQTHSYMKFIIILLNFKLLFKQLYSKLVLFLYLYLFCCYLASFIVCFV